LKKIKGGLGVRNGRKLKATGRVTGGKRVPNYGKGKNGVPCRRRLMGGEVNQCTQENHTRLQEKKQL